MHMQAMPPTDCIADVVVAAITILLLGFGWIFCLAFCTGCLMASTSELSPV
jgi:hypothetical protein